ncbi:hypothetical protein QAD02_023012 [Eretmocerus hayati]|uniref:Uncharacterized protein n=1 Tax=Eretmocerus hayati TaxID=131215 RepID=A0ACC2PUQ2_9HYME|nr:hypothetical protein QAD02_023012 [Eretmocerus hayati]
MSVESGTSVEETVLSFDDYYPHFCLTMQTHVVVLAVLVAALVVNTQAGEVLIFVTPFGTFPLDVESMINDEALVQQHYTCLMEDRRCTYPISNIIKYKLKRILFTECEGCNDVEMKAFKIVKPIVETKYSKELAELRQKYSYLKNQ